VTVWTDEWCLVYSPTKGLEGSELYHQSTDPKQTRNMMAEQPMVAKELLAHLEHWFDDLAVSPARTQQLLHDAPFTTWDKLRYQLWLRQRRRIYNKQFRNYPRGADVPS